MSAITSPGISALRDLERSRDRDPNAAIDEQQESKAPTLGAVVGMIMVLAGLVIGVRQLSDNSFLTHLATGRLMLDGGIVRSDSYTWTSSGDPWVVQSWLASLVYGGADKAFGAGAIRLLTGVMCAGLAAGLWMLARPVHGLVARVGIVGSGIAVGAVFWTHRPLMFGLLGVMAVMLVLERGWPAKILAPVLYVWVQTHGSFPLGVALIVAVLVGGRLDGEYPPRAKSALKWSLVGVAVGAVANPYGPEIVWAPVELLGRDDILRHVNEWASPDFRTWYARLFVLVIFACVAGLVRRPTWRRALPAAMFVGLALMARRNVPVASIVLVPLLVDAFAGMGGIRGDDRKGVHRAVLLVVGAGMILVGFASVTGEAYELERYPVAEIDALDELGLLDGSVNVAHPDIVGNYIEWRSPGSPVFVDDRYELHRRSVFQDYLVLDAGTGRWDEILDERSIDIVIWRTGSALDEHLRVDPSWDLESESDSWVVHCRAQVCDP